MSFGDAAGEVDLGDLGAALFAEPLFCVLVAVAVERVAAGVHGCLDQRPAQVAGPVLGECAAAVGLSGLVDARAEAGVAGQLCRCGEAADVADLGCDRVGEHPADAGDGQEQRHVAVLDTESLQLAFAVGDLAVELVDQLQAGLDRAQPRFGQR
jgi:hypothetical protein